ncbi:MAG: ABC transporter permease [Propionibacteriaceae bacterium]|nr:ABC transporter permease [Propionibacteriaceae bacterium]
MTEHTIDHDAQAAKVARWGALLHAKNVVMQLRAWAGSVFGTASVESLLTVLALGVGLGVVVDQASPGALGVPFLQFVAPALVLSVAVHGAHIENMMGVMAGFKWHETYLSASTTPTTPRQLMTGHMIGASLRYVINVATVVLVLLPFGGITWLNALILFPIALLTAWAFGNLIAAWTTHQPEDNGQFSLFSRLVILPLTLFSGTYFPLDVLPTWLHPIGWASPLWHGVNLARIVTLGQDAPWWLPVVHVAYLAALAVLGWWLACRAYHARLLGELFSGRKKRLKPVKPAAEVAAGQDLPDGQELIRRAGQRRWGFLTVAARGLKAAWGSSTALMVVGGLEPLLYLAAMGFGLGTLMGQADGAASYAAYIAPGLLASSAMMGAILDTVYNVFMKLKLFNLYEGMLATSLSPRDVALGEIIVALVRGGFYATAFLTVMVLLGLVGSWWAVLAVPACLLIAFGFAGIGMAATSFTRTFQQLDWIFIALMPMFMFSGTFYPVEVYPEPIATAVKFLPLWHGIEMMRDLTSGEVGWITAGHALYFVVLAVLGTWIASMRLKALFLR